MADSNTDLILKELNKVIIELLIQAPFFGRLLAKSVKVLDPKCQGVSMISFRQETVRLNVNPEYWNNHLKGVDEKQTLQLRKNTLKKQLIHFIFNHDLQYPDFENEAVFLLSAELLTDQYLEEVESPVFNIILSNFPDLKLAHSEDLINYYDFLIKTVEVSDLNKIIELKSSHFDYLKTWKNQSHSFSDRELEWHFRKQFILSTFFSNSLVFEHTLPAPLFSYLSNLKDQNHRSINWKRTLRLFYHSSKRTKLTNTIHRGSKRFGTYPGIRIQKKSRILVALDTSRSVNADDLNLFFKEIHQLWKQKAEIKVVECDSVIQKEYNYKGILPKVVAGRGNTDFNAPILFSNEVFQPDALIYFTDGFGMKPKLKSIKPLLWIINKNGIKIHSKAWNDLPGRKIKMNDSR